MSILKKVSGGAIALSLLLVLVGPTDVQAATSPSLGSASTYSILAGSEVTNTGASTVSGDVGISPGIGVPPHYSGFGTVTLGGTIHDADGAAATAQADRDAAVLALNSQTCDTTYVGAFHELAGDVLGPGVYCANSFHLTSGTLTLSGDASDVWIFKSASDLIITGSSAEVIFSGDGSACNVWSTVVSSATFSAGSEFVGTILADTSITFAAGASLDGRALASTAEVTMDSTSITGPTCTPPVAPGGDTGRVTPLINVTKIPNPLALPNGAGSVTYSYLVTNPGSVALNDVSVVDDSCGPLVYQSGDYNSDGRLQSYDEWAFTCTKTLTQTETNIVTATGFANGMEATDTATTTVVVGAPIIPPLINITKTPFPLVLAAGGGGVTYTYSVTNPGTVALTDVTIVDDKCTSLTSPSGDTDNDSQLDVTETWVYSCVMNLDETTENTVLATGYANGLVATDIAKSTVIVTSPLPPPLIHVVKRQSPGILPATGGTVTYTFDVTNAGTEPLNNVGIDDDQCAPLTAATGDTNLNGLLETGETWVYTCSANVTAAMTNVVTVEGSANAMIAEDTAFAVIALAPAGFPLTPVVPTLPSTGLGGENKLILAGVLALLGALALAGFTKHLYHTKH